MPVKLLSNPPTLKALAKIISAQVIGDEQCQITGLCPFDDQQPGCLAFTKEARSSQLAAQLAQSKASAFLISSEALSAVADLKKNFLVVKDPFAAIVQLIPTFYDPAPLPIGVSEKSDIHQSAKLGRNVVVGPFCSLGANVVVEDDVIIHPQVTIYPGVKIGARTIIHAGAVVREDCIIGADSIIQNGAVVGADGFGYVSDGAGGLSSIPQVGVATLSDHVEVGANSCVDRATLGSTFIGKHTKLDNLVQVGHNVRIGQSSLLCGHAGVAGSCTIGNGVIVGGHAGIADHLTIADGVRVAAKSGVTGHLLEKGDYAGYPAVPAATWRRMHVALKNLPKLLRKTRQSNPISDKEE